MNLEETKKVYDEILLVVEKYKDIIIYDFIKMKIAAWDHLFGLELKEKYGFNVEPKDVAFKSSNSFRFNDYMHLSWHGEKYGRTISLSDDGKQPIDELLLSIRLSTGAYIFGNDYPQKLFQAFFLELKSYNPKYLDTANRCLYFTLDNAGKIFNDFNTIMKKYHDRNKEEYKLRRVEKLKEELKKLEG